jgi:hypothetical protein
MFEDKQGIEAALSALSEELLKAGVRRLEMVVCGGAALNVLGYIKRTTVDVDIMAFVDENKNGITILNKTTPLESEFLKAVERVRNNFNLSEHWINASPASVIDFGLPNGLMDRVETRIYGENLIVHFLSRYDQIHFKLYAAADQTRKDVHYQDLIDLNPTKEEFEAAARWCMTHDISAVFKEVLIDLLTQLGHKDVAGKL